MRDAGKISLESSRPEVSAVQAISHCLDRLYEDEKHSLGDSVVSGLTFEELVGALLLAQDKVRRLRHTCRGRR